MSKHMSMLLVLVTVLALVAAPLFSQGVADKKASDGLTVIELWYGAAVTEAGPPPDDWVGFQIIKDKLNIDLRITALPSSEADQDVKVQAAAAANNLPDLFMVRRDVLARLVPQGLIASVDDLYAKMPIRTATHYDEVSRRNALFNGKSYGLSDPGAIIKNEGLLIRKDWLDNLGLAVPTTTDELFTVMRAFTFNDPDRNGKNDTYGYGSFEEIGNYEAWPGRRLEPIFGAFDADGTWDMTTTNAGLSVFKDGFFDAMVYLKRMVDEGVMDPNWLSYKKDDFRAAWKQGRFGIMREQNAAFAAESNYAPFDQNFPQGEWIVIDPPKGPKGHASIGPYTANFRIYAISAKAEKAGKKDKIAELLEWMASDEGYFLLGWGVEGVNYTFDKLGVPVADGVPNPEYSFTGAKGQVVTQLRNMVFYNGDLELYARYPTYTTAVSKKEMSALDVMREMQTKDWTAAVGSDTLPTPNADLKRFYEQSLSEFITGKRVLNRANWNAWLDEFRKLGGQAWNDAGVAFAKENNLLN